MRFVPLLFVALFFSIAPALAAPKPAAVKETGPKLLGTYGNWRAYAMKEHDQQICYMTLTASFPKNAKIPRSDALLTITHRPSENSLDVISYTAGYNYKPTSSADLTIGTNDFNLFTAQDTAWSRDVPTDHKIAKLIRTAPSLSITGTPSNKKLGPLTDKFGLKGAGDAYRAIGKACGLDVSEPEVPKAKTAPKAVKAAVKKKH